MPAQHVESAFETAQVLVTAAITGQLDIAAQEST